MPERRMGHYGPGPGRGRSDGTSGIEASGAPWVDGPPGEYSWGFEARRRERTNKRAEELLRHSQEIDYSTERFFVDTYRLTKEEILDKHEEMPMIAVNIIAGVTSIPKHFLRKTIYANELSKKTIGYGKKM